MRAEQERKFWQDNPHPMSAYFIAKAEHAMGKRDAPTMREYLDALKAWAENV